MIDGIEFSDMTENSNGDDLVTLIQEQNYGSKFMLFTIVKNSYFIFIYYRSCQLFMSQMKGHKFYKI